MTPEEVERVIGGISEKDVMDFARRKLWDQDIAVSAVGSIEGYVMPRNLLFDACVLIRHSLLDYNRIRNDMSRNA